jgi:hypothetical protein
MLIGPVDLTVYGFLKGLNACWGPATTSSTPSIQFALQTAGAKWLTSEDHSLEHILIHEGGIFQGGVGT